MPKKQVVVKKSARVLSSKARSKKPIIKLEIITDYLNRIYYPDRFEKTIKRSVKLLRQFKKTHPFDAIAFSGQSGSAMAYVLGYRFRLPLICVRKKNSNSHFLGTVEGCYSSKRYLIVDDFIETGNTVKYIIDSISKTLGAKPVGLFLYSTHSDAKRFNHDKYKIPVVK